MHVHYAGHYRVAGYAVAHVINKAQFECIKYNCCVFIISAEDNNK